MAESKQQKIEKEGEFASVKTTADKLLVDSQRLVDEGYDEITHHYQGGRDWIILGRLP